MTLNANALTTQALVKTEVGIASGDSSQNDNIDAMINAASSQIDNHCGLGRLVSETGIVENLSSFGTNFLFVNRKPLNAITSIVLDGDTVDATTYSIHDPFEGSIYRRAGWLWTAAGFQRVTHTGLQGTEERRFFVTYDAGYTTVPADLERAATMLSAHHFNTIGRRTDIESERLLSWSAKYVMAKAGDSGIPPAIAAMLAPYCDVAAA